MTKYKNKKKTLYFIMPTKQNGYPNLTAWTYNEFLAQGYAKQYQSLSPVILSCEGYDIKQLRDRARLAQVLKNRFGLADKSVGLCFYGENSVWKELPLPSEINDYEPFTHL